MTPERSISWPILDDVGTARPLRFSRVRCPPTWSSWANFPNDLPKLAESWGSLPSGFCSRAAENGSDSPRTE